MRASLYRVGGGAGSASGACVCVRASSPLLLLRLLLLLREAQADGPTQHVHVWDGGPLLGYFDDASEGQLSRRPARRVHCPPPTCRGEQPPRRLARAARAAGLARAQNVQDHGLELLVELLRTCARAGLGRGGGRLSGGGECTRHAHLRVKCYSPWFCCFCCSPASRCVLLLLVVVVVVGWGLARALGARPLIAAPCLRRPLGGHLCNTCTVGSCVCLRWQCPTNRTSAVVTGLRPGTAHPRQRSAAPGDHAWGAGRRVRPHCVAKFHMASGDWPKILRGALQVAAKGAGEHRRVGRWSGWRW